MLEIPKTPINFKSHRSLSTLVILEYAVLISFLLYFGRSLFIPLSFSVLISFVLYPICKWLEKKGVNRSIAIFISMLLLTIILGAIVFLLINQLLAFSNEWGSLKAKLWDSIHQMSNFFLDRFGISIERQTNMIKNMEDNSGSQLLQLLSGTASSVSAMLFSLIMVPLFAALILFQRSMLVAVIYRIFSNESKEKIYEILVETIHSYYNFIKGMLLVYLIVGILNSIGLLILGIPHPFLFGFIAAVLTFIPYVGIIIASLLPISVAWITYGSFWYPLGVIIVFTIVQVLEANIIFPFAVSSRLNVNTLVVLIVILAGGIIWGAAGMILFIPFLGIAKLIADRTAGLETLSILLGNGTKQKS